MSEPAKARTKKDVVTEFRKTEIIEAARRVIVREGPGFASMEKIAEEADISKGTLYLYFQSKEELIREATERGHADMARAITEELEQIDDPVEALNGYVRGVLQFCEENETLFRAMDAHPDGAGDTSATSVEKRIDDYVVLLQKHIEAGVSQGRFGKVNSRRIARLLVEGTRGLVIERLKDSSPPAIDEDTALLVGTILNGIKA